MKIVFRIITYFALISYGYELRAQDTLPRFSVVNRNGKVILSWVNDFPVIKQLSIQRSSDSLKGFKTILTLPDPSSVTNGFLDNNAPDASSYYKLYILLDNGAYIFSKAQKPQKYIPPVAATENTKPVQKKEAGSTGAGLVKAAGGDIAGEMSAITDESTVKAYSLQSATPASGKKRSDGLKTNDLNMARPQTYTPSGFVFTNPDGDITVVLPPGRLGNFKIRFYEENGTTLFQINTIKEHIFTVDKSNFLHAGWFSFELFEDGILKEKNKVRVP